MGQAMGCVWIIHAVAPCLVSSHGLPCVLCAVVLLGGAGVALTEISSSVTSSVACRGNGHRKASVSPFANSGWSPLSSSSIHSIYLGSGTMPLPSDANTRPTSAHLGEAGWCFPRCALSWALLRSGLMLGRTTLQKWPAKFARLLEPAPPSRDCASMCMWRWGKIPYKTCQTLTLGLVFKASNWPLHSLKKKRKNAFVQIQVLALSHPSLSASPLHSVVSWLPLPGLDCLTPEDGR